MARRGEETLAEILDLAKARASSAKRHIEECVKRLEELEEYLPKQEEVIAMYKLQLRMILQETKYL